MKNTKTLMLATFAVLSVGTGVAMAQESAGGFIAGTEPTLETFGMSTGKQASGSTVAPTRSPSITTLYGSSKSAAVSDWPLLEGADGNGG